MSKKQEVDSSKNTELTPDSKKPQMDSSSKDDLITIDFINGESNTWNPTDPESKKTPLNIHLGSILRTERKRMAMSQETFAICCEVTSRTVISWEKGERVPDLIHLYKLSKFGLDLSKFADQNIVKTTVDFYDCKEVLFPHGENKQNAVSQAMRWLSIHLAENPEYTLINMESVLDKKGEQIGIRYFYKRPEPVIYDESHAVRAQFEDQMMEDFKNGRSKNKG